MLGVFEITPPSLLPSDCKGISTPKTTGRPILLQFCHILATWGFNVKEKVLRWGMVMGRL